MKELLQYKTHQEVPVSEVRMRSLPRCVRVWHRSAALHLPKRPR